MKVALAISHGRMAPCFAGVALHIVNDNGSAKPGERFGLDDAEILSSHGWHPLGWGRVLMCHDVGVLLCAGIAQGTWAAIQGHGIAVIPNAMGDAVSVFTAWCSGRIRQQ